MRKMKNLLGLLLVFSLIIITSEASAESNITSNALMSTPLKHNSIKHTGRGNNYGEFFRGWHDWYYAIIDKPFNLHLNNVFIGKLIMSRDNRLEVRTQLSDNMTTRVTFENRGITRTQDTGHPNVGLGITRRMSNGLMFDTSVNFDLRDPSDVTFWLTLPAIRF
jgi:hypothetical protein